MKLDIQNGVERTILLAPLVIVVVQSFMMFISASPESMSQFPIALKIFMGIGVMSLMYLRHLLIILAIYLVITFCIRSFSKPSPTRIKILKNKGFFVSAFLISLSIAALSFVLGYTITKQQFSQREYIIENTADNSYKRYLSKKYGFSILFPSAWREDEPKKMKTNPEAGYTQTIGNDFGEKLVINVFHLDNTKKHDIEEFDKFENTNPNVVETKGRTKINGEDAIWEITYANRFAVDEANKKMAPVLTSFSPVAGYSVTYSVTLVKNNYVYGIHVGVNDPSKDIAKKRFEDNQVFYQNIADSFTFEDMRMLANQGAKFCPFCGFKNEQTATMCAKCKKDIP